MDIKMIEQFQNPGMEFRGKPFWAWNGKLEEKELLRQIDILKEMGFGGFFMHSRTGLVTEYLSDEWFHLINTCADRAKELGMEAWLYDEDRWPSGTAGGEVTKNPEYRLKFIRLKVLSIEDFQWDKRIFAAFICRLEDGINYYDCIQLKKGDLPPPEEGKSILAFSIEEMEKESFYNGYTYVDTMNREATEYYLQLTHEKYKQFSGDRFGSSIKGIFTDEPHRGAVMNGFGIQNEDPGYLTPWTPKLFAEYQRKFGIDLVENLPELFLRKNGEKVSYVKWCYVELLQELFLQNYAKPYLEWCQENGLQVTGHVLHEDNLTSQVALSGSVMRYYEYMDLPGIDLLSEHNVSFWVVKQLSSVARQLGKPWMLSELYGCTGWQMGFQGHKEVGDWQSLFGINVRCHHLSWYTMEGEAKRDFPASIHFQSGWWKEYKAVEDYFSRLGFMLQLGKPECDVLVIHPVESVWCQVYPNWSKTLMTQSEDVIELETTFSELFFSLAGHQIDFDYGDEEMISRLYSIDHDESGFPLLTIGQAAYKTIVVGKMTTIRKTTLSILKEFMNAGGHVIFAGETPAFVDAKPSDEVIKLANQAIQIAFDGEQIAKSCLSVISPSLQIKDPESNAVISDIFCQVRKTAEQTIFVLLNKNRDVSYENVSVRLFGNGSVEEWDCLSGKRWKIKGRKSDGDIEFKLDFCPSDLHVLVFQHKHEDNALPIKDSYKVIATERIENSLSYQLNEPNVCVLDRARFQFQSLKQQEEKDILKIDQTIRRHLGLKLRSGEMIQPWYINKQSKNKDHLYGPLFLHYDFEIDWIPAMGIELVLEQPECFKIKLNNEEINNPELNGWWIDPCFKRVKLSSEQLRIGKNTITLTTMFRQGSNLEAIYLIGNFGVKIDNVKKTVTKLPEKLKIGDITKQGLPFYSGSISYELDIVKPEADEERILLCLEDFAAACVKLSNHKESILLPWQPYEYDITKMISKNRKINLELILTRRNTFGPLHQIPIHTPSYGPLNFITE